MTHTWRFHGILVTHHCYRSRPNLKDADIHTFLKLDTTIQSLYGHQEGAQIGYNPHKPGCPSHAWNTYWVGYLRLVLNMQLRSGKVHSSDHGKAGLGHAWASQQDRAGFDSRSAQADQGRALLDATFRS